jgi:8-amino-7-oxononanoate synthase
MPSWLDDDLGERRRRGLYRVRRRLQSGQGPSVRLRGRGYVNLASNDYLNLAGDPRLAGAAFRAARRYGCGAGASPLVSGLLPPLRALERALARWERTEAALVFSSGFAANLALVSTLAGPEDAVFSDELNHASLIDGCRLSKARVHVYRHADANHLDELLSRRGRKARRRFLISDSIFSMEGDLAPVAHLLDLARRHDGLLILDEAHATGVFGEEGRGISETLGAAEAALGDRLIKVGTLSKALGSQGGFVCGSRRLIAWLVNSARPYIFSTALSPPAAAAARRAIALVREEPARRQRVRGLAQLLREQFHDRGLPPTGSQSQIIPVVVGTPHVALNLSKKLARAGFLVPAIRPPSVPEGTARLRISVTAGHREEDILRLASLLAGALKSPSPHL